MRNVLLRKISQLVIFQAALCALATYLISRISLMGRIGIATFYKEYKFLRSPWQTYLSIFIIQLLIILLLYALHKRFLGRITIRASVIVLILSAIGLWATYYDFQHTFSHRVLRERFHLGFYLFWIGLMITSLFFMIAAPAKKEKDIQTPFPEDPLSPGPEPYKTGNNNNTGLS
ncbi:MAG TPA: cytochrome d ubiquinol oxidase subunit II [Flavitalea sp.]|nr:cytochrome d ubiquinol oxidase subunit II [Flavitalea sp.]